MASNNTGKKTYTLDEIFGENSSAATDVLNATEEATLTAKSLGELRRITRMSKAKLRALRNIDFQRDQV